MGILGRMEFKPLKRHPSLQPLSREHMSGLVQARNLQAAAHGSDADRECVTRGLCEVWRVGIHDHFDDEERLLSPLIEEPARKARLRDEHAQLRAFAQRLIDDPDSVAKDLAMMVEFGTLLHDHIRWEERVLYEGIQHDHPSELAAMADEAHAIEERRPASRARCVLKWEGDGREKMPPMLDEGTH